MQLGERQHLPDMSNMRLELIARYLHRCTGHFSRCRAQCHSVRKARAATFVPVSGEMHLTTGTRAFASGSTSRMPAPTSTRAISSTTSDFLACRETGPTGSDIVVWHRGPRFGWDPKAADLQSYCCAPYEQCCPGFAELTTIIARLLTSCIHTGCRLAKT